MAAMRALLLTVFDGKRRCNQLLSGRSGRATMMYTADWAMIVWPRLAAGTLTKPGEMPTSHQIRTNALAPS